MDDYTFGGKYKLKPEVAKREQEINDLIWNTQEESKEEEESSIVFRVTKGGYYEYDVKDLKSFKENETISPFETPFNLLVKYLEAHSDEQKTYQDMATIHLSQYELIGVFQSVLNKDWDRLKNTYGINKLEIKQRIQNKEGNALFKDEIDEKVDQVFRKIYVKLIDDFAQVLKPYGDFDKTVGLSEHFPELRYHY